MIAVPFNYPLQGIQFNTLKNSNHKTHFLSSAEANHKTRESEGKKGKRVKDKEQQNDVDE